jgi:hypothetical protein
MSLNRQKHRSGVFDFFSPSLSRWGTLAYTTSRISTGIIEIVPHVDSIQIQIQIRFRFDSSGILPGDSPGRRDARNIILSSLRA